MKTERSKGTETGLLQHTLRMRPVRLRGRSTYFFVHLILMSITSVTRGQLTDTTQTPNIINSGIQKSYNDQIGTGRGDAMTPDSSRFIIERDPFRSIRRGRQIFQRKFTMAQGNGPRTNDGIGDIALMGAHGAGLADSCAACHGRPRGSAGFGGVVYTRPDSRDAPHLFGLGLVEMLADEITGDLRAIRDDAISAATASLLPQTRLLSSKGISYGSITAHADGRVDTSSVQGVDADLRVRPFFAEGRTISIREFIVGAFKAEMGLEAPDPDLAAAARGEVVVTPAGMVLDGMADRIEGPPLTNMTDDGDGDGVVNEVPVSIVDHLEFYLLNYFKPGTFKSDSNTAMGKRTFMQIGCGTCHIPDLLIEQDRRVADVETKFDSRGLGLNRLFATALPLYTVAPDDTGFPAAKLPTGRPFLVKNIFADFRRHDLGPNFHERNFDGTITTAFLTEPLWGVGSTPPYGHDGRSINLTEVILRHGGEAQQARDSFAALPEVKQSQVLAFLNSLILFPPDDTASNLDPANPASPGFPQSGHGSIKLTILFNDPTDAE